jgi:hypothetical protein
MTVLDRLRRIAVDQEDSMGGEIGTVKLVGILVEGDEDVIVVAEAIDVTPIETDLDDRGAAARLRRERSEAGAVYVHPGGAYVQDIAGEDNPFSRFSA